MGVNSERVDLSLGQKEFFEKYNRNKTVAFYTLGCKVNQYETEAMRELFVGRGYEVVDFESPSDVYVINTCSVTSIGEKKSRQIIRRAQKENPNAFIAVVGCYSQVSPGDVKSIGGIDLILGTNRRSEIVDLVESCRGEVCLVNNVLKKQEFEELKISSQNDRTRAYVKIQDGCDSFCSYCIIPYARGPVRSRDKESIVEECVRLIDNGYKEVVLTGIHISSYGKDLGDTNLLDLIKTLNSSLKYGRIRLGSLEPRIINEEFVRGIAECEKLCEHFHISLQSGSDSVIKRMNRKYTTKDYLNAVNLLKSAYNNVAVTTDIIAGFPGETEEEFKETIEFIKKVGFYNVHVFPYSERKGTPAAKMEQLPKKVREERARKISEVVRIERQKFLQSQIGKTLEVLFEREEDNGIYEGHSRSYINVRAGFPEDISGKIFDVLIEEAKDGYLVGKVLYNNNF